MQVYWEPQQAAFCGVHAVNNLLQYAVRCAVHIFVCCVADALLALRCDTGDPFIRYGSINRPWRQWRAPNARPFCHRNGILARLVWR